MLLTLAVLLSSLALLLAAAPTLWLSVDVPADSPCRIEALSAAIRVERPDASLSLGHRPTASDLEANLAEDGGSLILTVRGAGQPLRRVLPPAGATCQESLQTAALMIDRYLDELHASGEEARMEDLNRRTGPELTLALGGSVVQAPAGLSPGLTLEVDLRLGLVLLTIGGEVNLSQQKAEPVFSGAFDLQPAATWLAAGIAPRLGPGRLVVQASFGLSLLWVNAESSNPLLLPHQQQQSAVDPFLGLRAGYVLDLPAHFSLALRYEERWVPAPTSFSVDGYPASVSVWQFSGDAALVAGYTFF